MYWKQLESGKWKYYQKYKDEMTGKIKTKTVTLEKNTQAAQREAMAILADKIAKTNYHSDTIGKITVAEFIEKYKEWQENNLKESTITNKNYTLNLLIGMLGGDTLLCKLSAIYINQKLTETGKPPATINSYAKKLKAALRWGYKNDYIDNAQLIDKIQMRTVTSAKEKVHDKFLESSEALQIIERLRASGKEQSALLTHFLVLTGLRIGEAIALTYDDVSIQDGVVSVSKTYSRQCRTTLSPKTHSSFRDVPLSSDTIKLLKQIFLHNSKNTVLCVGNNYLFPQENGVLNSATYLAHLRKAAQECNISKNVTPHVLRHTAASLMMEQGLQIDTISRILGHENSIITREIYLHVTEKLKQNDFDEFRKIKIL